MDLNLYETGIHETKLLVPNPSLITLVRVHRALPSTNDSFDFSLPRLNLAGRPAWLWRGPSARPFRADEQSRGCQRGCQLISAGFETYDNDISPTGIFFSLYAGKLISPCSPTRLLPEFSPFIGPFDSHIYQLTFPRCFLPLYHRCNRWLMSPLRWGDLTMS